MEPEQKKAEAAPGVVAAVETKQEAPQTIKVDLGGKAYEVPLELGKEIIAIRQESKKTKDAVDAAERKAAAEVEKSKLLELMKSQDIEAVKAEVSKEYVSKIKSYEDRIFKGEIKSLLAAQGTLPEALEDASTLALNGVQVTLKDDKLVIGDKPIDEYVQEFIKTRPHLVAVRKEANTGAKTQVKSFVPASNNNFNKFAQGLFNKGK